jgi:hypothetical protein
LASWMMMSWERSINICLRYNSVPICASRLGGRVAPQTEDNVNAACLPPLLPDTMQRIRDVYDQYIRPQVYQPW